MSIIQAFLDIVKNPDQYVQDWSHLVVLLLIALFVQFCGCCCGEVLSKIIPKNFFKMLFHKVKRFAFRVILRMK